jgi:thiol-disulfide isomerase/thioredoxin
VLNEEAIFFVAHWCPHCQAEVPRLENWIQTHGIPIGLDIEIVSTRVNEAPNNYPPSAWLQREGLGQLPIIADDTKDTAYFAYGAGGLPYIVYLDKDNKVVLRTEGEYGDDPEVFTPLFTNLAAGKPVTNRRTRLIVSARCRRSLRSCARCRTRRTRRSVPAVRDLPVAAGDEPPARMQYSTSTRTRRSRSCRSS